MAKILDIYRIDFFFAGIKAFQIDGVNAVELTLKSSFTDSYGKSSEEKALQIAMKKDEFQKYDWKNLVGQNIYNQMRTSCYDYYIHPAILKNLKIDKLTLLSV